MTQTNYAQAILLVAFAAMLVSTLCIQHYQAKHAWLAALWSVTWLVSLIAVLLNLGKLILLHSSSGGLQ